MSFSRYFRVKSVSQILRDALPDEHVDAMNRTLGVRDLTAFGVAAIVGAGIFATIGQVCFDGGPGVIFLFVFTAIACGLAAMCYASFASMIPISGSAYTYSYASFGELIAWIIGWDLIIEYAIGNIAVAISWSNYFTGMLKGFGVHIPAFLTTDYTSARNAFLAGETGTEAYEAWTSAPLLGNLHVVLDFPAFAIVFLISALIYIGIRETRMASNIMVVLKVAVIILVIIAGAFYVNPENWSPFFPNGLGGVFKGVAGVFFAYIGFDAISTTAEECKNPQRDLPRSMIYALVICTILYIFIALVVTGMVKYTELGDAGDPLAYIFKKVNVGWISYVVSVSAIIAMASVLLVFQMGQPRIWMTMSRDGLLPPAFSRLHPRFRTPAFSTVVAGLLASVPTLFTNLSVVTDLTSIGTLFAFVLVCGGVIILDNKDPDLERKFKIPYIEARWWLVLGTVVTLGVVAWRAPEAFNELTLVGKEANWYHAIPLYIFLITIFGLVWASFQYKVSLIPALGLLICLFLMSQIEVMSWFRFGIWLVLGLVIYFAYGQHHSKLNRANAA